MKRKGVSTLISAVLLITFVIAIGGVFSEWSSGLVRDVNNKNTDKNKELVDCAGRQIVISDHSNTANWVNATLRARGGDLGNVTVTVYPDLATQTVKLEKVNDIEFVNIKVSQKQDELEANSHKCNKLTRKTFN